MVEVVEIFSILDEWMVTTSSYNNWLEYCNFKHLSN
jgi:hypothetical protein